jgi:molybdopterin/thiamine biosynthesis adenylyltransferase
MKILYHFFVIGAGGTGTYFLKEFSRFLQGGAHEKEIGSLVIFDGDTVEDKNLARQSFEVEDIGKNKAVAMAQALNEVFGLDWRSMPYYLTDPEQIKELLPESRGDKVHMPVIVGCVDNHAARLLIEGMFEKEGNFIFLDSANEFYAGESVFAYKMEGHVVSPCRSHYFPEILKADKRDRTEMSCEELNNVAPQHIVTNMMAGQVLFSEVCSLLNKSLHPGLVTFDAGEFLMEYRPYKAA